MRSRVPRSRGMHYNFLYNLQYDVDRLFCRSSNSFFIKLHCFLCKNRHDRYVAAVLTVFKSSRGWKDFWRKSIFYSKVFVWSERAGSERTFLETIGFVRKYRYYIWHRTACRSVAILSFVVLRSVYILTEVRAPCSLIIVDRCTRCWTKSRYHYRACSKLLDNLSPCTRSVLDIKGGT